MYQRILLKLSGEALSGNEANLDPKILNEIALQIKDVHEMGVEVAIVVGGGNFIRGKFSSELGLDRVQADYMGMLGTMINALAVQGALEKVGVPTVVQSAVDMIKISEPLIVRKAIRHLEKKKVVIFGAGTGSPFFSTDTTAALRASEVHADAILMAKNGVDGVYSADPKKDATATKYDILTYMELIQKNLGVMDLTAASMCNDNNIETFVFNMNEYGNIKKAVTNEVSGTRIVKE